MNYFVFEARKSLVKQMMIGVSYSDDAILSVAASVLDSSNENFEKLKKCFLKDIHEMSGK